MDQRRRLLSRWHFCRSKEGVLEFWSPDGSSNARYQPQGRPSRLWRGGVACPGPERESNSSEARLQVDNSYSRTSVSSLLQCTYILPATSRLLPHQRSPSAAGSILKKASLHATAPIGQAHLSYRTSMELKTDPHLSNISEI